MAEETTPQATWTEGPSIDSMSGDDAKAEIKSIEKDPSFAGEGKMDYWSRQKMLKRRDSLYRHAFPENVGKPYSGMEETLQKQGITEESLQEMHEGFEQRDEKESRKKAMESLKSHFGTEDEAKKGILQARGLLNRFASEEDLLHLEQTGLGDSAELIQKLAEIAEIFKKGGKQ